MFINYITIENFKGISSPVKIELKPITLLYGPNSVGKSTILHSLMYAYEVLRNNNCNVDHVSFSDEIDLGGFEKLVHNHDLTKKISISIGINNPNLIDNHQTTELSFTVEWDASRCSAYASSLRVSKIFIQSDSSILRHDCCEVNYRPVRNLSVTPSIKFHSPSEDSNNYGDARLREIIQDIPSILEKGNGGYLTNLRNTAIPPAGGMTSSYLRIGDRLFNDSDNIINQQSEKKHFDLGVELDYLLNQAINNPLYEVLNKLENELFYIGPLRSIPQRNHQFFVNPKKSRWATGIAAWDLLNNGNDQLISRASKSLFNLHSGYHITLKKELTLDIDSDIFADLKASIENDSSEEALCIIDSLPIKKSVVIKSDDGVELEPKDIGTGISQVLPILVCSSLVGENLIAIEQPELHIHPAMQLELADVMVINSQRNWNPPGYRNIGKGGAGTAPSHRYLIETHSEHILLRLLTRIKNTYLNYGGQIDEVLEKNRNIYSPQSLFEDLLPIESDCLALTKHDVAVYYIDNVHGSTTIVELKISDDGDFENDWPKGFFEEREKGVASLMFYEYALDPDIFLDPTVYDFICNTFGRDQGRLISEYPRNGWISLVYKRINSMDVPPLAKKRLKNYLIHLKRNSLLDIRRGTIVDSQDNWLANYRIQHELRPFHAFFTDKSVSGLPVICLGPELLDSPLWKTPISVSVNRDVKSMFTAVKPLLEISKKIILIDRNFNPAEERFTSFLFEVMSYISTRNDINQLTYITSFDSRKETIFDFFRLCNEILPAKIIKNTSLKILVKPYESLHDRYILTDIGCLEFGVGLDTSSRGDKVNITRQSDGKKHNLLSDLDSNIVKQILLNN